MTTTTAGPIPVRVNDYSGLCDNCASGVAQSAVFWTDDNEFGPLDATVEQRFAHIQRIATDARANCQQRCGRVTV